MCVCISEEAFPLKVDGTGVIIRGFFVSINHCFFLYLKGHSLLKLRVQELLLEGFLQKTRLLILTKNIYIYIYIYIYICVCVCVCTYALPREDGIHN